MIFNNKPATVQDLLDYYEIKIKHSTIQTIFNSIPHEWIDCIKNFPWIPQLDGNWATVKGSHISITTEESDLDQSRPFCSKRGFLDVQELPLTTTPLKSKDIRFALSKKKENEPFPPLRKLWKANVPSKFKDVSWLVHHNAIWSGSKARRCGSNNTPHNCYCGPLETTQHIFLDCPHAKEIWNAMTDEWSSRTRLHAPPIDTRTLQLHGWDLPLRTPLKLKSLWQRLFLTAIYSIWLGRCHNVYDGPPSSSIGRWIVNTRRVDCMQSPLSGTTYLK